MKKFAMAAVAAAALSAGVAQAYTVGTFSNGFVVPNVIHNGPTDTTAVGLSTKPVRALLCTGRSLTRTPPTSPTAALP